MPVIGSSSVTPDFNAVGPSGPTGAIIAGPVGATGVTGATGTTGATGIHVVSTSKEFPYLKLHLSDGSEVKIKGVAGITGATGTVNGVNLGDGITIFSTVGNGVTGATMWFKGITSDGSISVYLSSDSNTIAISGDNSKQGGTAGTLATDRFLYLSDGGTASASGLTFESGGIMSFDNTVTLDPEENIITIASIISDEIVGITGEEVYVGGETAGDGTGIQLEVRNGSVYKVNTPIGIAGFTGEFNSDEVFSFTAIIEGNDIWDWPTNVYFDEDDAYFSCAEDIINFISSDGGLTWNASFAVRGYGVSYGDCDGIINIGSCCYVDDQGEQQCIEYTTKGICEEKNMAVWSMLSDCSTNCGITAEGICCSDGGNWGNYIGTGICVEGKGLAECNYFGGSFWDYLYYEDAETEDGAGYLQELETPIPINCNSMEDLCAGPCDDIACCKDGVCIGDSMGSGELGAVSSNICKYVLGGVPVEGGICGEVDCCDHSVLVGACCLEEIEQCQDVTNQVCSDLGGIFMGPGTDCATDICCFNNEKGICCLNNSQCNCCDSITGEQDSCCQNLTYSECSYIGGNWHAGICPDPELGSCQCGKSDVCYREVGACCLPSGGCAVVEEVDCTGTFYADLDCSLAPCGGCCCTCQDEESILSTASEEYCESIGGSWYNTDCDNIEGEASCCHGCKSDDDCKFGELQFCCEDGVCEVCPGGLCASDSDCPDGSCCCDGVCGQLKDSGIPGECTDCNLGGSCHGACCVNVNTLGAYCRHTTEEACNAFGGGFYGCDSVCGILEVFQCLEPADMCCCCWAGGDMCLPYWPQFGGTCYDTCWNPFEPGPLDDCENADENTPPWFRSVIPRCCTPGTNNDSVLPNCNGCLDMDEDGINDCGISSWCSGVGGPISAECTDMCGLICVNGECYEERCCGYWPNGCPGGFYCDDTCCMSHQQCCGLDTGKCCHKEQEYCCNSDWGSSGWIPTTCCKAEGIFYPEEDSPCIGRRVECGCQNCHTESGCRAYGGDWDSATGNCYCSICETESGCASIGGTWVNLSIPDVPDGGYCDWGSCETKGLNPGDEGYACEITDHNVCFNAGSGYSFSTNQNNCRTLIIEPGETCCSHATYDQHPKCCKDYDEVTGYSEHCCLSLTGKENTCCPGDVDDDGGCCPGFDDVECCGAEEQCGNELGYNCVAYSCDSNGNPIADQQPSWFGQCCDGWSKEWDCGGDAVVDPENDPHCQWTGNWMCCPTEMDCMMNPMDAVGYFTGADLCGCYYYSPDCGGGIGGPWVEDGTGCDEAVNSYGWCVGGIHLERTSCCYGNWKLKCNWFGNSTCDCTESTGFNENWPDEPDSGCCGGTCYDNRSGGTHEGLDCCNGAQGGSINGAILCPILQYADGETCCCKYDGNIPYDCTCCPDSPGRENECCGSVCYDKNTQKCCTNPECQDFNNYYYECVSNPENAILYDLDAECCDNVDGFACTDGASCCNQCGNPESICCPDSGCAPTVIGCGPLNCDNPACVDAWGCASVAFGGTEEPNPLTEPAIAPDKTINDPSMPDFIPYFHSTEEPIKESKTSKNTKKEITKNSTEGLGRYIINGICQEMYCEGNCQWPRC